MHIAINAAKKCEIRVERRDIRVEGVVYLDRNHVVSAEVHIRRHVKSKRRKTALMLSEQIPIDVNIRNEKCPVELQKHLAPAVTAIDRVMRSIPANAAIIIIAAILAVQIVPGVRQIQVRPRRIIEGWVLRSGNILPDKTPIGINDRIDAMVRRRNINLRASR